MVIETNYKINNFRECSEKLLEFWSDRSKKVFVIRADSIPINVKDYYFSNFKWIGKPFPLGEDATEEREKKSDGSIWFEVRNDSSIPNAYRHSCEAQPLHTDGSYIPNYPSSTIMACVNNYAKGGETIFINSIDLFEILELDDPLLLKHLMNESFVHERSGLNKKDKILKEHGNDFILNWNYFCLSTKISKRQKAISDQFFKFLETNEKIKGVKKSVKLSPGDSVFWRDDSCLHGRNSFVAKKKSDRFLWKCAIDIGNFTK